MNVQTSKGLGPISQIEPLKTARSGLNDGVPGLRGGDGSVRDGDEVTFREALELELAKQPSKEASISAAVREHDVSAYGLTPVLYRAESTGHRTQSTEH